MIPAMTLGRVLQAASISFTDECSPDLVISDLTADSRQVTKGALFCAFPGLTSDGRDYIAQAAENGAAAVLCETYSDDKAASATAKHEVPIIYVEGLQAKLGVLADEFFGNPSANLQVFGVTGTNGKTTCCYLLAQAFSAMGMRAAIMGTLGYGFINDLKSSTHTTPDAISVHRYLAELVAQQVTQVAMEVSSHALDQGRVNGVQFYATLFTNLSHDHLDYHGDMAAYGLAKQGLFTAFQSELAVLNADDALGAQLLDLAVADFVVSYGRGADVDAEHVTPSAQGLHIGIEANGVDFELTTPLVGLVNVPNLLLLVASLLALSTPVEEIIGVVAGLQPAPGRMELFTLEQQPSVVIDYAHTPDALEKALLSVREHCSGKLWCVFGCGGDRDKEKRAVMGEIAAANADYLVVTNDNPRGESPEAIAQDILAGIANGEAQVILDRAQAIQTTILDAAPDDWVLIAGKGHETTQTINQVVSPFSDREHVRDALGAAA